ncbi:hypothetical protein AAEX28_02675 [Lentisphaerota bacterium WC36G]|nr:hypothetical protein LJT99_05555 [Lentisphaerae bacterium WC36]
MLIAIITTIVLSLKIYKTFRELLDNRVRVSKNVNLRGQFSYLFLLLPLGLIVPYRSVIAIDSKYNKEVIFSYGMEDVSGKTFLFAAISIMLFQYLQNLKSYDTREKINIPHYLLNTKLT